MLHERIETASELDMPPAWSPGPHLPQACEPDPPARLDWHTVDRALRDIARRRAALDADEARWLREAEALQIWRPLGMVSAVDYLERALGYAPRTAQDRLRVARALGSLPQLTDALSAGELPFSSIRELTRVATPATEASWIAAARGKNLRQVEELVADHRPGDRPDDPPDPEARTHVVRLELSAETFALLRQTRTVVDDEHGTHLPDDAFVAALCSARLDGAPATEPTGRARYQVALTICKRCHAGWQEGAGVQIPISPAAVERALCDAQHIGSLDAPAPERSYQDIPPSVARLVWRRDGGRCRVTGCRSARGLELHHIIHRSDGGSHDASNLILACSACHQAHHAGTLTISGTADHLVIQRRGEVSVRDLRLHQAPPRSLAFSALVGTPAGYASADNTEPQRIPAGSPKTGAQVDAPNATSIDEDRERPRAATNIGAHVGAPEVTSFDQAHEHPHGTTSTGAHDLGAPNGRLNAAILRAQAKDALTGLGWKPAVAQAAVAQAAATPGSCASLERLIFESLRRCPAPKAPY